MASGVWQSPQTGRASVYLLFLAKPRLCPEASILESSGRLRRDTGVIARRRPGTRRKTTIVTPLWARYGGTCENVVRINFEAKKGRAAARGPVVRSVRSSAARIACRLANCSARVGLQQRASSRPALLSPRPSAGGWRFAAEGAGSRNVPARPLRRQAAAAAVCLRARRAVAPRWSLPGAD